MFFLFSFNLIKTENGLYKHHLFSIFFPLKFIFIPKRNKSYQWQFQIWNSSIQINQKSSKPYSNQYLVKFPNLFTCKTFFQKPASTPQKHQPLFTETCKHSFQFCLKQKSGNPCSNQHPKSETLLKLHSLFTKPETFLWLKACSLFSKQKQVQEKSASCFQSLMQLSI